MAISVTVFSTGLLGYVHYRTSKNLKEHNENMEFARDNTRQENESFGIGWGYRADDIIMSQIDTGDLLMIKFDCT